MATFGQIRFDLSKLYPGADHDVLDSLIIEGYQTILDRLEWQRIEYTVDVAVPDEYNTGTVAVTNGSATITGTGTTWTSDMTGRMIRFAGQTLWYMFTYVSATSGTLSRAYEGDTATGTAYQINKNVVQISSNCRSINHIMGLQRTDKTMLPKDRNVYGPPTHWAPYMDSATDPPNVQIELFPIPEEAVGLIVEYSAELAPSSIDTSVSLLPWVRPAAVKAYVQAELCKTPAFLDLNAAQLHATTFEARLSEMRRIESEQIGPLKLSPPFTRTYSSWKYPKRYRPS